ncbi:(Fe-S)-binding protein [Carboxydothermus pertinax]|uniref:Reductase n=1 Tax=Carboxydothermus pertinax TaxID=870242 RepID=A0A1L8CV88_9THEO|nr:(Fe-S)-binding protein [Carboxydothermus pertinax]GAV22836.1 reductase [Carboxydothermus pertinax]
MLEITITPPATIELVRQNILKYKNPLGLKGRELTSWAEGLSFSSHSEYLFYTGTEYQMLPYIDSLVKALKTMNQLGSGKKILFGLRNLVDKFGFNPEKVYAGILAKDREKTANILRKHVQLLNFLGITPQYLGEEELYAGALLYEYGYLNDVREISLKLTEIFKSRGVKKIIVASPHAAEMFRKIYPMFVDFPFEVFTMPEFLKACIDKLPKKTYTQKITIHDPCRLARELGVVTEIREVLKNNCESEIIELPQSGRFTTCCGGATKLLFPELAEALAKQRVQELERSGGEEIVTACPYCYFNLSQYTTLPVKDLTEILL